MDVIFPRALLSFPIQSLDDLARQYAIPGHPIEIYKMGKFFNPTIEHRVVIRCSVDTILCSLSDKGERGYSQSADTALALLEWEYVRKGVADVYDGDALLRAKTTDEVDLARKPSASILSIVADSPAAHTTLIVPSADAICRLFGTPYKMKGLIGGKILYEPEPPENRLHLAA